MIGMSFASFLILLVISVVVAAILHYWIKLYIIPGLQSFLSKVAIGWIGAWLGSPVLGHWWAAGSYQEVYFVPAILGSLAIQILVVDVVRTCAEACGSQPAKVD